MSSSDKGLASLSFPPLMYGALAIVFGVVMTSFILGPSGMAQLQSAVMDILGLLDVIAGMDQAAIDSALATSYAMSCTSLMNLQAPDGAMTNAYAGEEYIDAGPQLEAEDEINNAWYEEGATPLVEETCNQSTTDEGVEFGVTNVTVTCDDFERGGGCDVHGFTLPQQNVRGGWVEWILGRGTPEHILYYQALPSGVDESWKNLGEKYNAMGVAIGAGVSMVSPSLMKIGKVVGKQIAKGAPNAITTMASTLAQQAKSQAARASYIAYTATRRGLTFGASTIRQRARQAGILVTRYLKSKGARQIQAYHKLFARDVTTYAAAFARTSDDWSNVDREMVEEAVDQVARELREKGYTDLDQAAVRADVEDVLRGTELGDHVTDEGVEAMSEIMSRRWIGASRETAEEFADQATQQRVAHSVTRQNFAKLNFRQNEFQEQAFRRIGALERLLGQSSDELLEGMTVQGAKGEVFETIYGKGIKTVKYVSNPQRLKRTGIRAACSSGMMRVGMFEGAMSLMQEAESIANHHDAVSEAYAEDMERLEEGDVESESGLNFPQGLGHCLAYQGMAAGQATSRMCGRVGVDLPASPSRNIEAQYNGVSACAAMTMAGITADKLMTTRTPYMPQEVNSLQLFNPVHGTMEFPLNRFANFHFMSIDKTDVGIMGQDKERFYLVSPVQTKNESLRGDEAGKVSINPGGIAQRVSGKQRAEKGDTDVCNAVDQFKEFIKENFEEAILIGMAPVAGPIGLFGLMAVNGSLPEIVRGQDIIVSRDEAINDHNLKGSFLEEGLCPNNVMYTDLPIVGKEVIMDDEYEYQDTVYQEEMQSVENADRHLTAPPGFKEAYPSDALSASETDDNETQVYEEDGETIYQWSSAMSMAQPIDMGKPTDEYLQVGDWLRTDELDDRDVTVKEVADVGAVFDLASAEFVLVEAGVIDFELNITEEISLPYPCLSNGICHKDVSVEFYQSIYRPNNDISISLDAIPVEFPSPQISVEDSANFYAQEDDYNLEDLNITIDWEITSDDFTEWVQEEFGIEIGIDEIDLTIEIPKDLMFDDWYTFGIELDTTDDEPDDPSYDGVVELGGIIEFGNPSYCPIDTCYDLAISHTPSVKFDYFLNTGWIPRKYISQFGEGMDSYRPPPGLVGSAIEFIDSDRALNYHVNALDVTLDTGADGPYKKPNGDPLFGYDANDGEAGSMAIYLIGGVAEMAVTAFMAVCSGASLGSLTVLCAPISYGALGIIGGLTELAAQSYQNGCSWPVHGCDKGLMESIWSGAKVGLEGGMQAAGIAFDVVTDAADNPAEATHAVVSTSLKFSANAIMEGAGAVGNFLTDDVWDFIQDAFFQNTNETEEDETLSGEPRFDPPVEDPEE